MVAVNSRHFLDQVDLALEVGPPARRSDGDGDRAGFVALTQPLEPERFQDALDVGPVNVDAQHALDLGSAGA